jgi:hypothetical protein
MLLNTFPTGVLVTEMETVWAVPLAHTWMDAITIRSTVNLTARIIFINWQDKAINLF